MSLRRALARLESKVAGTSSRGWGWGRASRRARIAAALARHGRRERLCLMLTVVERMRPVEVALTLGVSVRQVERSLEALFDDMARAARREVTPRLRRAA